jgi:hypothetical protein
VKKVFDSDRKSGTARKKSAQKNYRLSPGAIELIETAAERTGFTNTEVVEASVALYAASRLPALADNARAALVNVVR